MQIGAVVPASRGTKFSYTYWMPTPPSLCNWMSCIGHSHCSFASCIVITHAFNAASTNMEMQKNARTIVPSVPYCVQVSTSSEYSAPSASYGIRWISWGGVGKLHKAWLTSFHDLATTPHTTDLARDTRSLFIHAIIFSQDPTTQSPLRFIEIISHIHYDQVQNCILLERNRFRWSLFPVPSYRVYLTIFSGRANTLTR